MAAERVLPDPAVERGEGCASGGLVAPLWPFSRSPSSASSGSGAAVRVASQANRSHAENRETTASTASCGTSPAPCFLANSAAHLADVAPESSPEVLRRARTCIRGGGLCDITRHLRVFRRATIHAAGANTGRSCGATQAERVPEDPEVPPISGVSARIHARASRARVIRLKWQHPPDPPETTKVTLWPLAAARCRQTWRGS